MALVDPTLPAAALAPARTPQTCPAPQGVPHAALARLALLRGEAAHDLNLLNFLARAPLACLILMAVGTCLLVWQHLSASNAPLEREFVWALSVLTGILAITGLHIRSYAQGGARIPLHKAATGLRRLLFYTGAAWGSGALLVIPLVVFNWRRLRGKIWPWFAVALALTPIPLAVLVEKVAHWTIGYHYSP